ncbi:TetR/AcrR family transcriptional regulator [Clostridium sp. 'deep sea']|uniref:TetR/AcrR family transcriptional regulator n=1 Tax=Clostridium sp. 'deep sea' TaxID=2779445 RepID=UPI0018969B5E|nr:TetR/AcrR family transcriptional regulator [Clostridium sp. 'deep sea']QOR33923.1 TetR/AcrR family transcriptional regulator [Clostridium sp. 'deep sea']
MLQSNYTRLHDKKDRIITACIKEFATRGYDKCSTSLIAEKAGVSKALIFHYFGNKQKLYWAVVNHAIVYYIKEIEKNVKLIPGDIIHNLRETAFLKSRINYQYPLMTEFIMKCFKEERRIAGKRFIEENYEYAKKMYESVYGNINLNMFLKGLNIKMAIKVVSNTFDGYGYNYVYSQGESETPYNWKKSPLI